MPHIHLETTSDLSENVDIPDILGALVDKLSGFETISSAAVKAHHTMRTVWCVGKTAKPGFAHCTVAILEGRPLELRKQISAGMCEVMKSRFAESMGRGEAGVTLELREMAGETYAK